MKSLLKTPGYIFRFVTGAALLSGVMQLQAVNVTKLDTTTMNGGAADWSAAPATTDIGEFAGTPTLAHMAAMTLGGSLTLGGLQLDGSTLGPLTVASTGGFTLTLGTSGINMAAANNNATLNCALSLGGAQTWNVASAKTLTIGGVISGANLLTIAGTGNTTIGLNDLSVSSGLTKNGFGTLTINGGTGNAATIGSGSMLTVNGGLLNLNNTGGTAIANLLNSTANVTVGGGGLIYTYNQNTINQSFANLTINPGESALFDNRSGSFNSSLVFSGTVTRNIGGTITARQLDTGREQVDFSGVSAITPLNSGGSPYLTLGNAPSGTAGDNYNDWGQVNSSHQLAVVGYTSTTASSLGTSAQNANANVAATTLATAATDASYRDNLAAATVTDVHGFTWQTGGILITAAKTAAGSIIKDTVGGGALKGPASSDLVIMISANNSTPAPFTISANIVDNTGTAITKGAPGTLILSGNNAFTGGVYINDGIIQLGNAGALNSTTPNAIKFNGSGMITGLAGTSPGTVASAPTLALGGNSIAVASISTANNQSGVLPVIENGNGSVAGAATLTVNGAGTFSGVIQDGPSGGALGYTASGGSQILGGTLSYSGLTTVTAGTLTLLNTPTATSGYKVSAGTLDLSNLAGSALTLGGSQILSGGSTLNGTVNGNLTTTAGTVLAPGSGTGSTGGSGTNTIGNLTVVGSTVGNFGLSAANSNNCLLSVGTLTLPASGTMTLNLYSPGTASPFATAGTYNLFQYTNLVTSGALASEFSIGTSIAGFSASYSSVPSPTAGVTNLTLTLTAIVAGVNGTWSNDVDGAWSTAANWDSNPNIPHAAGDLATFGAGSALRTVTLDTNVSVGGITMTNVNSYVIAAGGLGKVITLDNSTFGANVVVANGTANVVQTPLSLNDNVFVTVNSSQSLAVSGVISNAVAVSPKTLTINGTGTNILSGANTYGPSAGAVGTTLLGGGVLQIGNNTALGAGDVNITGSSTVQAGASTLTVGNNMIIGVGQNATVDNNADNLTLGGVISGSGSFTEISSGTVKLSGANTYAGNTVNSAGTLKLGASNVIPGGSGKGNLSVAGVLDMNGFNESANGLSGGGTIDNLAGGASVLTVGNNSGSSPFSGLIQNTSGTLALVQNGSGTLTLSGANTYSGGTTLNAGQLNINNAGSGGTSSAIGTGTLTIAGGTIDNTSAGDITLSPVIAQNWNGDFIYSGSVHNLNLGSGAVTLGASRQVTVNANTLTVGGVISGTGFNLTKNGSGTLVLSGANNYSGTTTVNAGLLQLPASGAINGGALFGQGYQVNGGTVNSTGNSSFNAANNAFSETAGSVSFGTVSQPSSAGDGQLISISGGNFMANSFSLQRTASHTTAPTATAPQSANTTDGLYINGGNVYLGALSFALENSSASVRVDSGSLTVTNELLIGNMANSRWSILHINGGTFNELDSNIGVVMSQVNPGTGGGASANNSEMYLSGGTSTIGKIAFGWAADTAGAIGGAGWLIVNNGSLYVGSGGIQQSNTATTYSVNIALLAGTMGAAADWSTTNNMQLSGTGFNLKAADLAGTAHNISLSGIVSGAGALTKTGGGTLTLAGPNTYTGLTIVSNGTMLVTGSIGAGGMVVTNATLSGTGTIGGAVTNLSNAILAPGVASVGTLNFSGALTLSPSSTNSFAVTTAGGAANKIAVAGLLTPSNSVVKITSGTSLRPGTNTLFTYGTISGAVGASTFNPSIVFDVAPVHPALLVDNGSGNISLVIPNTPPTVGTNSYTRNPGISLHIAISELLTNSTDADGDTVTFAGVGTSTNGMTVSSSGGFLFYTNTNNVDDQFTYSVTDGFSTNSGLVKIVVNNTGVFGPSATVTVGGSSANVSFAGIPGYNYTVQRSTNMTDWVSILTTNAPSNGLFNYTDTFSDLGAAPGSAFYRLQWNP